jgi:SAM-dependent methyltransferase
MATYDAVAEVYDHHFDRPCDRWEDERLADLLRPYVASTEVPSLTSARVLDLGCGTGWLLDHLPVPVTHYVGIDTSAPMLARLTEKHPRASVVKATVGVQGWLDEVSSDPGVPPFDVVTATWAAHDLPNIHALLSEVRCLVPVGGYAALHGQAPRYRRRRHYVLGDLDERRGYLDWTPGRCRLSTPPGWRWLGAHGTGAAPEWPQDRRLWRLALTLPARAHWAFLAVWQRTL